MLEDVASYDLWIWHAFFGVAGANNDLTVLYNSPLFDDLLDDVNVLRASPLFNDLKTGRAPDVEFFADGVPYKPGYYLADGIYPEYSIIVKSIKHLGTHDHKR